MTVRATKDISMKASRTSTNSKLIQGAPKKVYDAFITKEALEYWLAPYGMTGKIHDFDARIGGGYDMSLVYKDQKTEGKTTGNEDRFSATFVELRPYEKVVQTINFKSDKSEFTDEMIMEVLLEEVRTNATKVTILFKNIPTGVDPKDNEDGTEQSLEKLAEYIENS